MQSTLTAPDQSDEELMTRVQGNDSVAFGKPYDRHAARALMVAQTVCRDVGLAEDAVQEGFLSVWRGRATYKPGVYSSFRGWAMTTVRNRARIGSQPGCLEAAPVQLD